MDTIITVDDAAGYLINHPNMASRPNFFKVRALRLHIAKGLRQIHHPERTALGWSGMAIEKGLYALVDIVPWAMPTDPGPIATYDTNDGKAEMKMKDAIFKRNKCMFQSGDNISRAVIRMLKAGIEEKYQMSNLTGVKGWHNAMTVGEILTQLETNYGRPDPSAIQAYETMCNAPHSHTDSPESLFHKMEQCQEVAMLADNPYTEKQIITKTVEHLKRSGMFPTKEYEDWGAITAKTYVLLKQHFYKAYTRRLDAIQNGATSGQHGYVNSNQYGALMTTEELEDSSSGEETTVTLAEAMVNADARIDRLMETNTQIMAQLASMTIASNNPPHLPPPAIAPAYMAPAVRAPHQQYAAPPAQYSVPPVTQVTIPTRGGYNNNQPTWQGRGGGRTGGGRGGRGRGARTPFADYVARNATPRAPTAYGGGTVAMSGLTAGTQQFTSVPNIVKQYNNWNMCYSCGFDVEDAHTSATCPQHWRKEGHQEGCTRQNVQQYIDLGHKPRMRGALRTQLPTM